MHPAISSMKPYAQPNLPFGLISNGQVAVIVFDVHDPNHRRYRVEVQSSLDGTRAIGLARLNPWSEPGQGPNAGEAYEVCHCHSSGFLCLGSRHRDQTLENSPYDVEFVLRRVVYWCTGFSVLKEKGYFPQPGKKGA